MSKDPNDWSTIASENASLALLTKKVNGETVVMSRSETNDKYAEWKIEYETEDEEPAPQIGLVANIIVRFDEDDDPEDIIGNMGIFGTMKVATGIYWVMFLEERDDDEYADGCSCSSGTINVSEKHTTHFVVEVVNNLGVHIDPNEFSVRIFNGG